MNQPKYDKQKRKFKQYVYPLHIPKINIDYANINTMFMLVNSGSLSEIKNYIIFNDITTDNRNEKGESILHIIIKNSNLIDEEKNILVEIAINNLANISAKDISNVTPLHLAAGQQLEKIINLLLSKGSDINAQDNFGMTPLNYLIMGKDHECQKRKKSIDTQNINIENLELVQNISNYMIDNPVIATYLLHYRNTINAYDKLSSQVDKLKREKIDEINNIIKNKNNVNFDLKINNFVNNIKKLIKSDLSGTLKQNTDNNIKYFIEEKNKNEARDIYVKHNLKININNLDNEFTKFKIDANNLIISMIDILSCLSIFIVKMNLKSNDKLNKIWQRIKIITYTKINKINIDIDNNDNIVYDNIDKFIIGKETIKDKFNSDIILALSYHVENIGKFIVLLNNNKFIIDRYFNLINITINYKKIKEILFLMKAMIINFKIEFDDIEVVYKLKNNFDSIDFKCMITNITKSLNLIDVLSSTNIYILCSTISSILNDLVNQENNESALTYIESFNNKFTDNIIENPIIDDYDKIFLNNYPKILKIPDIDILYPYDYITDKNIISIKNMIYEKYIPKIFNETYFLNKEEKMLNYNTGYLINSNNKNINFINLSSINGNLEGTIGIENIANSKKSNTAILTIRIYLDLHFKIIKELIIAYLQNNKSKYILKSDLNEEDLKYLINIISNKILNKYLEFFIDVYANSKRNLIIDEIKIDLKQSKITDDLEIINNLIIKDFFKSNEIINYNILNEKIENIKLFKRYSDTISNKTVIGQCYYVNLDLLKKFIKNENINLNVKSASGETAIFNAINLLNIDIIEILLPYYNIYNPKIKNNNGYTIHDYIIKLYNNHFSIINENILKQLTKDSYEKILNNIKNNLNSKITIKNSEIVLQLFILKLNNLFYKEMENKIYDANNLNKWEYSDMEKLNEILKNTKLNYSKDIPNKYYKNNSDILLLLSKYQYENKNKNIKLINNFYSSVVDTIIDKYNTDPLVYDQYQNPFLFKILNDEKLIIKTTLIKEFYFSIKESINKYIELNNETKNIEEIMKYIYNYMFNDLPIKLVKIINGIFESDRDEDKLLSLNDVYIKIIELLKFNTEIPLNNDSEIILDLLKNIFPFYKEYIILFIENMKSFSQSYLKYLETESQIVKLAYLINK
jgi:hypothetical protein